MESSLREPSVDTDKLKNTIFSFCYPQSSRYGKNKVNKVLDSTVHPVSFSYSLTFLIVIINSICGTQMFKRVSDSFENLETTCSRPTAYSKLTL